MLNKYMFARYFGKHFSTEEQVAQNIDQNIIGLPGIYFAICFDCAYSIQQD